MRFLASLILFLAAAASSAAPASGGHAPDSTKPTLEYLLDSAAKDFLRHGPDPAAFRNVRFGRIDHDGEATLFLMCGEVQPATGRGAGKWIEFATLKTSGYEQWLGAQGGGYCNRSGTSWEPGDLSAELQRRVDAAKSSRG